MTQLDYQYSDGGRKAAGFKGMADDCVVRAIAIATGLPYREIYDAIDDAAKHERKSKARCGKSSARTGVYKSTIRKYLNSLGWQWTPMMNIGSGCHCHLIADELPLGILIVQVSRHITTVIDHCVYDTYDPARSGTRCVYGYWKQREAQP